VFSFGPFSFERLSQPGFLWLVPVAIVLALLEWRARHAGHVALSTAHVFKRLASSSRVRFRFVPPLLRLLALTMLIVALAGPVNGFQVRKNRANVIDIMLVLDTSGSMVFEDFSIGGRSVNRLEIAKEALSDFMGRRKEQTTDRFGVDRLGLILFARNAWTQCPLTLDYGLLQTELDNAELISPQEKEKDGTAIGSATGLAIARLKDSEAKSKVIVLLTDGINNAGNIDPLTAADIAKKYGIRVYTIGAGSAEAGVTTVQSNSLLPNLVRRQPIDEDTMRKMADITGGKYYRVTDTEQLMTAYAEIDALETTEIDANDYYEYRPAFLPWAIVGAALMFASVFTRRRWFEALP
jgi:Ca-activated chloride channel family protein